MVIVGTCPQVSPVESVREEVIANPISSPVSSSTRVWNETLCVRPANVDVRWEMGNGLDVVNDCLVIPLVVHGRAFASTNENVGMHAKTA